MAADGLAPILSEFEGLKEEQKDRINRRDGLVYANIAATAAAGYAAFQSHMPAALLAVPVVGFLLGWTYLTNDVLVSQIGDYIRDDLAPRAATLTGGPAPFQWERHRRDDGRRRQRKHIQLGVDLSTFCGPGLLALILAGPRLGWWAAPIGAVDIALLSVLAWQVVTYSTPARSRLNTRESGR